MSDWLDDEREIKAVALCGDVYDRNVGDTFERIERAGEMAMVPWIKIFTYYEHGISIPRRRVVEAPLRQVQWIEFTT